MAMLKYVAEEYRTVWSENEIQNKMAVQFKLATLEMSLSEEMRNAMLSFREHRMYETNGYIGYGIPATNIEYGMTEAESYSAWIEDVTDRERNFKKSIPLLALTQAQYDALYSLYYDTGTWKTITAPNNDKYDVEYAVENERWLLVADMLASSSQNRRIRQLEARVLQLGDYTPLGDRASLRLDGIQDARKTYVSDTNLPRSTQQQIEHAYYRQLGAFVPTLNDLRKKQLVIKYGQI